MILTSAERILAEFLRAKDDRFLGPFTLAQAISLLLVVVGALLVARAIRRESAASGLPAAEAPA